MKLFHIIIQTVLAIGHWVRREFAAANTYEAAVETHADTCIRTNDVAITARHLLWKKGASDTTVALCTASDVPLGTIDNTETSTGVNQTVLLVGRGNTKKMVASGAINAGGLVYTAASGKVAGSGTYCVGQALTATSSDNDIVEVNDSLANIAGTGVSATLFDATTFLYATSDNTPAAKTPQEVTAILNGVTVETVAATNVITAAETGKTFFLGHATEFASTLPAPAAGLRYTFIVSLAPSGASYTIVSASGTDNIYGCAVSSADAGGSVDSTAGTAADTITFVDGQAQIGDRIDVISDGTYWYATGMCADEDAITFTAS